MALDMTTALTIRAKVDGLGQISGLTKGLDGVTNQSNAAAGAMGRLRGAAAGAMGAMRTLLPVLGVGVMAKFAKDSLDAADAMSKMSQRTGVAAPMLDKFRKVAELSDTSIEGLGKGFKTLASNMYDAQARGIGPAADAFNKLGIAVADSSGKLRSSDQVMLDIADRFKAMADGPEKAALAADLFGAKIGDELIPLLNSGGDAVRKMGTSLTQDFADKAAAFNDRLETMQEKLGDVGLRLTEALLPALEALTSGLEAFTALPEPLQALIIGLGGLGIAFAAISPIVTALGAVLAIVFTGPVGIAALVIAAGIAIYAFRDKIGAAFTAIGEWFKQLPAGFQSFFIDPLVEGFKLLMEMINTTFIQPVKDAFAAVLEFVNVNFVEPIQTAFTTLIESIKTIFSAVVNIITSPFKAAFETVRGIVNQILNSIGSAIGSVVNAVNNVIRGVNRGLAAAKLPQIPLIPAPQIPSFAEGGVVSGPTLAMVGEGGEPEYIVPQSKATKFANNWLSGVRGAAAIPKFAEGGVVVPGSAQVSIQTGPVTQMNGTNYVTTQDLSSAVTAGVNQTLSLLRNDMNTRRTVGLA